MYYEEKIVDGVLCYRWSPKGKWIEFTAKQLTERLIPHVA
jgi:hypothetical protein